ncbi:MAG: beta-ketoacyl synthase N-terminal-like domain-containing protein [Planctomycetota bacterium]
MRRRVVITGVGCTTGLGADTGSFWGGLVEGRSSLRPIERFESAHFPTTIMSELDGFDVRKVVPKGYRKATKVMARDIELAVNAAQLAAKDAGIVTRGSGEAGDLAVESGFELSGARLGCQIGAGLIAADTVETAAALSTSVDEDGSFSWAKWGAAEGGSGAMNNLPPLWMLKYLPNMLACHVTIIHGAEGPSNTILAAEASGILCVGEASRVIERGDADACFAGGAESKVNLLGIMRTAVAQRLADTRGTPGIEGVDVVRPYDGEATGTLIGEGAGILIVEGADHAEERGAPAYAEVAGFGAGQSTDAPLPGVFAGAGEDADWSKGAGELPRDRALVRAIRAALDDAGIGADEIDAVVPGAIGVPEVDAREAGSLAEVFGDRLGALPLVTVSANLGSCSAGHGALQVGLAALCLREQKLPARLHRGTPVDGLDVGEAGARSAELGYVLACVSSLGGQCAAVVLKRIG